MLGMVTVLSANPSGCVSVVLSVLRSNKILSPAVGGRRRLAAVRAGAQAEGPTVQVSYCTNQLESDTLSLTHD